MKLKQYDDGSVWVIGDNWSVDLQIEQRGPIVKENILSQLSRQVE